MKRQDWQELIFRVVATLLTLGVFLFAGQDLVRVGSSTSNWIATFSITWGIPLAGLLVFGVVIILWVLLRLWAPGVLAPIERPVIGLRERIGALRWLLIAFLAIYPAKLLLYTHVGFTLDQEGSRLAVFISTAGAIALLATRSREEIVRWNPALAGLLLVGSVFAMGSALVWVTDYPLSISWSEGNRIWDYSIMFGRDLYNYPADRPLEAYIDQGRQALWGLPFLLPGVTIWQVRLWSGLVFTVPYAILGWVAFRPQRGRLALWAWAGLWALLFLNQGPIYTPLVLSAVLVALARKRPLWLGLPLVFIAGYYAQLSRLTWMFAPAIWAGVNALVDAGPEERRLLRQDWSRVFGFGLAGILGGFALSGGWRRLSSYFNRLSAQASTVGTAGQPTATAVPTPAAQAAGETSQAITAINLEGFNQAITDQPLIWSRLWPNPTYGLGIVLGLLLATGALIVLLIYLARTRRWELNFWQKAGIVSALGAFLVVGLVVSVKIGGGSNLHNLDMFLIGLLFTAALAWDRAGRDVIAGLQMENRWLQLLVLLAVAIPAFHPMLDVEPLKLPEQDRVDWTLELIRSEVERVRQEGGEILFMDQRQLLTFGYVGDVPLVPEYEKKLVMDKALSGDAEYFKEFYEDLANHRFAAIVNEPLKVRYAEEDEGWGAENDAWVTWVSEPMLCYYEPKYTVRRTHVWILTPRAGAQEECTYHLR